MAKISNRASRRQISRPRKIIILIFIVVFWIIFYWYTPAPPPDSKPGNSTNRSGQEAIDYSR